MAVDGENGATSAALNLPPDKSARATNGRAQAGRRWRAMLALAVLLAVLLAFDYGLRLGLVSVLMPPLDAAAWAAWYRDLGVWGIGLSLLMMALCALTFAPAEAAAMASGAVYGALWGSVLTWVGAMLGANLAFGLARLLGPGWVRALVGDERFATIARWTERRGALALLVARCIPFVPFFALNLAAGALSMRWWTFNWVTAVGILPATVTFVTLGDVGMDMRWQVWLGAAAVVILAVLIGSRLFCRRVAAANHRPAA